MKCIVLRSFAELERYYRKTKGWNEADPKKKPSKDKKGKQR